MTRPHIAGLVEDRWNTIVGSALRARDWGPRVVPHPGYAGPDFVRVLARVVLAPTSVQGRSGGVQPDRVDRGRRGWHNFITVQAPGVEVTVTIGDQVHTACTDRTGVLDVRLPNPGLAPGWADITLSTSGSLQTTARVFVVAADQDFGIISDIDDTVIRTLLPRPLLAAYNTFVLHEQRRRPVPGMASLYDALLHGDRRSKSRPRQPGQPGQPSSTGLPGHPGAPTIYVSTGAWNTAATLTRFLERNAFPPGALLLTDWGPTNTGWFRSGPDHKRACLETLATDFPAIGWVLVGDDGQHDPALYAEFAHRHPDRVRAVLIRQLTAAQQVLAHGTPLERDEADALPVGVVAARGVDGDALEAVLRDSPKSQGGRHHNPGQ